LSDADNDAKEQRIIQHLCDATENDPDCSYVKEFQLQEAQYRQMGQATLAYSYDVGDARVRGKVCRNCHCKSMFDVQIGQLCIFEAN
jgi:hypothetical protein